MLETRALTLLRIFLGEADKADGGPLYEALVIKARAMHLAGATVLRGPMGFGHASRLHTSKILRLSHDLPMIVEIIDERDKLMTFLETVAPLMGHAVATLQPVDVVSFSPASPQP